MSYSTNNDGCVNTINNSNNSNDKMIFNIKLIKFNENMFFLNKHNIIITMVKNYMTLNDLSINKKTIDRLIECLKNDSNNIFINSKENKTMSMKNFIFGDKTFHRLKFVEINNSINNINTIEQVYKYIYINTNKTFTLINLFVSPINKINDQYYIYYLYTKYYFDMIIPIDIQIFYENNIVFNSYKEYAIY